MTAVIYARYSTDSQREESIEGQIRECTAYAEKNGFTVVKHYIDRAISAKTDNRPQFQQMIKDSERGIFDVIIVWNYEIFSKFYIIFFQIADTLLQAYLGADVHCGFVSDCHGAIWSSLFY